MCLNLSIFPDTRAYRYFRTKGISDTDYSMTRGNVCIGSPLSRYRYRDNGITSVTISNIIIHLSSAIDFRLANKFRTLIILVNLRM